MTWFDRALEIVEAANSSLPENASILERSRAIRRARPSWYSDTSWGRKVWPRAVKAVMSRYTKSDTAIPDGHLSPMERMMRGKK